MNIKKKKIEKEVDQGLINIKKDDFYNFIWYFWIWKDKFFIIFYYNNFYLKKLILKKTTKWRNKMINK